MMKLGLIGMAAGVVGGGVFMVSATARPPAPPPVTSTAPTVLTAPIAIGYDRNASRCRDEEVAMQDVDGVAPQATRGANAMPPPGIVAPPAPPPPPPMVSAPTPTPAYAPPLARTRGMPQPMAEDRERYAGHAVASVQSVADAPVSTFSIDVDTGSYANVRRMLTGCQDPPASAVRTEEMINYFRYDYPLPADRSQPFGLYTDVATTPWNANTRLIRVGLRAFDLPRAERPAANLVFLVDVSGSMEEPDKLPLVKTALSILSRRLTPRDRVSIVVYAGAAGIVLQPTSDGAAVRAALDRLQAGGSTAGGAGLALAYATARANRIEGGVNRVILATDGDFNVGTTSDEGLVAQVTRNRQDGITLTTLGFGSGNYNEAMMERIADVGNGNYAYIDTEREAAKVLDEELASTLFTVAKDVKLQVEFNPAVVSQYRLIGYENRALAEEDFANDAVDAGDVGAGHQVTALYEIVPVGASGWLPPRRYGGREAPTPTGSTTELAWLKLRYKLPDGDSSMLVERPIPARMIADARRPAGDFAFAVAVAAFGQKLRGDKYLGGFTLADVRRLAGSPADPVRRGFLELAALAEDRVPGSGERQLR